METPLTLAAYAARREALLARLERQLLADPRCVAAWLGGSYGRGEQDAVSDLDLFVVVDDAAARTLCARPAQTDSCAPPERLALLRAAGALANIHENHNNAPPGGSFSAVLYQEPAVIVDWVLVPRTVACRPAETRLLFDRAGIPHPQPLPPEAGPDPSTPDLAERLAFFAMMAAVTAKYIVRADGGTVAELLAFIERVKAEIETLAGPYKALPALGAGLAGEAPAAHLRRLCDQVQHIDVTVGQQRDPACPPLPVFPRAQIETILNLKPGA